MKIHSILIDKKLFPGDFLKLDQKVYKIIKCIKINSESYEVNLQLIEAANEATYNFNQE